MGNKQILVSALVAAMLSTDAQAESTSDALTKLEAETMLLKAREKQLDVQASILTKQNEIAVKQGVNNAIPQISAGHDPVVRGIEGLGSVMYATLELGGGMIDVQQGDILSNGMRVVSIKSNGVIVRGKDGKDLRLASAISGSASSLSTAGNAGGNSAVPPLPLFRPGAARGAVR